MDPVIAHATRIALALLFAGAALHKLRDFRAFGAILTDYQLVPSAWTRPFAAALIAAEISSGGLLLLAPLHGAALALALLFAYSAAISVNLVRGRRQIECGCGGAGSRPIGTELLVRNGLLCCAVGMTTLPVHSRALTHLDWMTLAFAVASIAFAWKAAGQLADSHQALSRERIES